MLLLVACGQADLSKEKAIDSRVKSLEHQEYQTVIIQNMERTLVFEAMPQRAVTLNQHVTEIMLALGLADYMVGTAYLDDEILPQYKEQYEKIPILSDRYPSQEVFLSVEPDFAYAGWGSAFREDNIGTVEQLEQFGVKAYLHQSSTIVGPTIDDIFQDILNIGKIFNVEDRANELILTIEKGLTEISDKIGKVDKPIRVFVYDSGEDAPFTVAKAFMNNLITMAGGENIFADVDRNWAKVTWEEVVNRDPEIIVIVDYGETTVEQKRNLLLKHPALVNVTAIKEERFVIIPLSAVAEGVRFVSALETLAKNFYPDKF
jgi:iron complex transport system substrate-binding protein